MLEYILSSFGTVFQPLNLLIILLGTIIGIIIGALPGLSGTMGVAVLIPLTYGMDHVTGLVMLAAVYCGSTYGGSISAILVNTPGTPNAAATGFDGHPMALKGHAGEALIEAAVASHWGGQISAIALLLIAPPLAAFSLKFGPQENFMLGVFGLTIIASMSGKDMLKGIIAGLIGLFLGCIGMDPQYGYVRFTFKQMSLMTGLPTVPTLVGLFSVSQILTMVASKGGTVNTDEALKKVTKYKLSLKDLYQRWKIYVPCGIMGTFIGMVPAAGGSIAAFLGYDTAKKISKHPETFGEGNRDGVAGPESANNGVTGGCMIPMMTLGIPGNAVSAILMGALMLHGLTPGNDLFTAKAGITYPFIISLFVANIVMLFCGLFGAKQFAKVNRVPQHYLVAVITVLVVIGSMAVNNSWTDIYIMLIVGVLGYVLRRFGFDMSPVVLGFILGPSAEKGWLRTLIINGHDMKAAVSSYFTRPICLVLLAVSLLSLLYPVYMNRKAKKKAEAAAAAQNA